MNILLTIVHKKNASFIKLLFINVLPGVINSQLNIYSDETIIYSYFNGKSYQSNQTVKLTADL